MRLTWIGQQFGRDALCEGHYTADVDQTMVRPSALCKGHYAADVDRATVWPDVLCKGHYTADVDQCKNPAWLAFRCLDWEIGLVHLHGYIP